MFGGTRDCPWCAERIKMQALVCRHCGRDVPSLPVSQTPSAALAGTAGALAAPDVSGLGCGSVALVALIAPVLLFIGVSTSSAGSSIGAALLFCWPLSLLVSGCLGMASGSIAGVRSVALGGAFLACILCVAISAIGLQLFEPFGGTITVIDAPTSYDASAAWSAAFDFDPRRLTARAKMGLLLYVMLAEYPAAFALGFGLISAGLSFALVRLLRSGAQSALTAGLFVFLAGSGLGYIAVRTDPSRAARLTMELVPESTSGPLGTESRASVIQRR